MIAQITDLPNHVVGFKASGTVTKEEFDTVLIPAVDELAIRTGRVNYLFMLDTDVSNMNIGAWFDDLKVGIKHLTQWHKIAIVSDQEGVNKFTTVAAHVMPGQVKAYTIAQLDAAKQWLAE